jgi:hypothetical protein
VALASSAVKPLRQDLSEIVNVPSNSTPQRARPRAGLNEMVSPVPPRR